MELLQWACNTKCQLHFTVESKRTVAVLKSLEISAARLVVPFIDLCLWLWWSPLSAAGQTEPCNLPFVKIPTRSLIPAICIGLHGHVSSGHHNHIPIS